ncbi:MAG: hypothetical protein LBD09_02805, partial [Treponema sp.]|nr:hypothetical protein [Treponema sp.]
MKKSVLLPLFALALLLILAGSIPLLFSPVRTLIIETAEQRVFNAEFSPRHYRAAGEALYALGLCGAGLVVFLAFWFFTPPGRYVLAKAGFMDVDEGTALKSLGVLVRTFRDRRFELFCAAAGLFVFLLALSRAALTGI